VRYGPSTNTRIRQSVGRGQQVMELQREGDWIRVEIIGSDGREGWIHGSLLAPPGGEPLTQQVAAPSTTQPIERQADTSTAAVRPEPPASGAAAPTIADSAAAAPGEVAVIAPEAATTSGETLPGVGQPARDATTIEPAAAPPRDESPDLARFRQSVEYLNSRALSVAGVDLFTGVEATGSGVAQVAATDAWSTIPPAGQESYANTLLDRWAAARGYGGAVSVQIVAPDGHVLLERTKP
jgi:Bacterial SH3 domain